MGLSDSIEEQLRTEFEIVKAENKSLRMDVKLWRKRTEEAAKVVETFEELQVKNKQLKRTMRLHAGDCCSLSNEVDLFRSHWEYAEERVDRLEKILRKIKDWAIVDFNEDLIGFIRVLESE